MPGQNGRSRSALQDSVYAVDPNEEMERSKAALLRDIRRSAYVYRVDCGGCNGCEIEIFASITPLFDAERFGIKVVSSPRHADILLYTGSMTRSMRVPALRAYHAAPDPKICVAYGACGCSGGIFHDLYGVWGGADQILPIDVYIPGCPPTPPATIYGFAVALGLLGQKLKAEHYQVDEASALSLQPPDVPYRLRVEIEREARRMAGYWHGKRLAAAFLGLVQQGNPLGAIQAYMKASGDPRLEEIFERLQDIFRQWEMQE